MKERGRTQQLRPLHDLNKTPDDDVFSFRPLADEDNAPTERNIVAKDLAADQLSISDELKSKRSYKHDFHDRAKHTDGDETPAIPGDVSKNQNPNMIAILDKNFDINMNIGDKSR